MLFLLSSVAGKLLWCFEADWAPGCDQVAHCYRVCRRPRGRRRWRIGRRVFCLKARVKIHSLSRRVVWRIRSRSSPRSWRLGAGSALARCRNLWRLELARRSDFLWNGVCIQQFWDLKAGVRFDAWRQGLRAGPGQWGWGLQGHLLARGNRRCSSWGLGAKLAGKYGFQSLNSLLHESTDCNVLLFSFKNLGDW